MAANSPESVLRLLDQCKTMERHLTAILMECLLKLSSATSTSVFLLVEDGVDGLRRISGSAKLCNAFKSCALVPTGGEMELFLDDPNPAIYEKPIGNSPPMANLGGASADFGGGVTASASYELSGADLSRDGIQRLGRKRLSDGFQSGACGSSSGGGSNRSKHFKRACKPTFLPPPPPPVLSSSSSADVVEIKDEAHDEDSPDNVTVSFDNSPGLESNDGETEAIDSPSIASASVVESDGRNNGYGSGSGVGGGEGGGGGALNFETDYAMIRNSFQSGPNYQRGPIDATSNDRDSSAGQLSSPSGKPTLNQDFGFDVEKFLMENDKYRAVANIRDPAIMEKSNIANKLLTSLLYDISKSIVIHSPYRENKNKQNSEYFNRVFEIVWEHLPYLNELNDTRAKFNGKSPRYYVRHTMQAYYIVLMSKCVSQAQNQSAGYRAIRFLD